MSQIPYTQWVPLPLANGYKAAVPGYVPSYRIEGDMARLRGQLDATTASGNNNPVNALPAGITPAIVVYVATVMLVLAGGAGQVAAVLTISGNNIQVLSHSAIDGFVYLDGLMYSLR